MAGRRKILDLFIAGAFATKTSNTSSFNNVNVGGTMAVAGAQVFTGAASFASLQVNSFDGGNGWRGIATINSGTTVSSVAASAARSGAVILTTIIQYASMVASQAMFVTGVESVRAGAFEIRCVGSVAPVANCPVAWMIVR